MLHETSQVSVSAMLNVLPLKYQCQLCWTYYLSSISVSWVERTTSQVSVSAVLSVLPLKYQCQLCWTY